MIAWALWLAAGQVSYQTVMLEDVVARSELVVTIRLDQPASTSVQLPVPTSGTKACGTYNYGAYTGTVVAVAHPQDTPPVALGERIVVFLGNTPELLELSALACETGVSKSPIFQTFKGASPTDGSTRTALLRWENGIGWVEAVSGSWLARPPSTAVLKHAGVRAAFDIQQRAKDSSLCVVDADCTRSEIGACTVCAPCTGAGVPMTKAVSFRFRSDCWVSLGKPPSPCGPCAARERAKVVCRAMRCVEE